MDSHDMAQGQAQQIVLDSMGAVSAGSQTQPPCSAHSADIALPPELEHCVAHLPPSMSMLR